MEISWKEGKNITKKLVKKKNKKKEVEQESFFNLFKSIDVNSEEFTKMPKE
jgi:nucleosome assembly protein 1-like 1